MEANLIEKRATKQALACLITRLLQSPGFRFSVGSIQYEKRVFLKTEYSKLYTTGLSAKVL
jgi:hypothetical protein